MDRFLEGSAEILLAPDAPLKGFLHAGGSSAVSIFFDVLPNVAAPVLCDILNIKCELQ